MDIAVNKRKALFFLEGWNIWEKTFLILIWDISYVLKLAKICKKISLAFSDSAFFLTKCVFKNLINSLCTYLHVCIFPTNKTYFLFDLCRLATIFYSSTNTRLLVIP
ncbi:hypothetical protein AEQU2_02192 [Aequorivita lipolytica]|nr:hypothetical protein AEQU2_02192 [Aequorivita lipolytica]